MKSLKLLLLLLVLCPSTIFAQQLSGLWIGALTNDSTSVRKDQSFEIVLSQYKEKVYGYSRSTFIVNDTLYYIVKRVKGTINGDVCEVKDDHVVSHNFPKKPEKGVKVISTFHRNKQDSTWYLAGDWKTTQTKKYYTVSGKVDLKEEKDLAASKLFPHLEELGLDNEMPFYVEAKKVEAEKMLNAAPKLASAGNVSNTITEKPVVKNNPPASTTITPRNTEIKIEPVVKKEVAKTPEPINAVAKTDANLDNKKPANTNPVIESKPVPDIASTNNKVIPVVEERKPATDKKEPETLASNSKTNASPTPVENKPIANNSTAKVTKPAVEPKPTEPVPQPSGEDLGHSLAKFNSPAPRNNTQSAAATEVKTNVKPETKPVAAPVKPAQVIANNTQPLTSVTAAVFVGQRITEAPQFVNYTSDSLVLILYDNGEVDGDTVSVILNGQMFMAKQGLKTTAIRKTIYITPGNEDITLVLYAENLGKYPPNTGLLVVYDGEERHQLRFSADLNKNASVAFRRKK